MRTNLSLKDYRKAQSDKRNRLFRVGNLYLNNKNQLLELIFSHSGVLRIKLIPNPIQYIQHTLKTKLCVCKATKPYTLHIAVILEKTNSLCKKSLLSVTQKWRGQLPWPSFCISLNTFFRLYFMNLSFTLKEKIFLADMCYTVWYCTFMTQN